MKRIMAFLCVGILTITMVGTALARSYVQCLNCGADATVTSYGPWERKHDVNSERIIAWDERTVTLRCTKGHTTTFTEQKNRIETRINREGAWDRPGLYVMPGNGDADHPYGDWSW